MSSCGSNAGMETSAHQSDSASNHPHPALFLLDSLSHILK